jgi:predicted glycosyltransferase involved in capsule biosynthesis
MNKPLVSILIPFRSNGDRDQQLAWLKDRWSSLFPEAEIIIEADDGNDPFSKTMAVNNCYKKATSDILVLMDADCWIDPELIKKAAEDIRSKKISWARPCHDVYKLTKEFTFDLIKTSPTSGIALNDKSYSGITKAVGFVCVFSRDQFEKVGGMDTRFRGWGGEDNAWNVMLDNMFGKAEDGVGIGYHLWHPTPRNAEGLKQWKNQTGRNNSIVREYNKAIGNKTKIVKLAQENKNRTGI